jgi:hypothetical protein
VKIEIYCGAEVLIKAVTRKSGGPFKIYHFELEFHKKFPTFCQSNKYSESYSCHGRDEIGKVQAAVGDV